MVRIKVKQFLLVVLIIGIFLGGLYFYWLTPKYVVPILTYHNIDYKKGNLFVTPENFVKQMEYIKNNGYQVITFDKLVQSIKDHKHLKGKNVVITIDDGYMDNFTYAYPVLKKFGFPAIIFLATDFIGKDKNFLSWEEIATMSKGGVSFGAHTKSHLYLGDINDEKLAKDEIEGSKRVIEGRLGIPIDYFCYPNGGFNEKIKELVIKAGYKGACTTNRGFADLNTDVYELKRIKPTNADIKNPISFWLKLSGYYNIFRKEKSSN